MTSGDISERVLRFIAAQIETVPQLEALLLLWGDPARAWSADEIAVRIYVLREAAEGVLESLKRRQLAASEGEPPRYRYAGAWDTKGDLMPEIAAAYRHHLVQIATFIHLGASPAVREFARAFDLKKEP